MGSDLEQLPDIVAAVFKHHGFSGVDYRFQKSRSYTVREYVTQYLESDFAFINRLCEEEGIWYAFEQHGQHGDVVVFGDSPEHYLRSQGLPVSYRPHAGLESVGTEALFNLSIRHNPIVEGIRTADYNYCSADIDLFAETDNKESEELADNTVFYDGTFSRFYTSGCNCIRHWFRGGYACRCWNILCFKFHKRCYFGRIVIMKKAHNISLFIYDEAKIKANAGRYFL